MTDDAATWPRLCMRCRGRVIADPATGEWQHAEIADAIFCDTVMRAPERVAEREGKADE